ncbi:M48 family metallopeptidase [Brumimicrobium aurantiacum]|uniref:Peptidase M48 domain-containing protein n=1 Tax=Brumimicrobium aurantiacum TaxID=1737063 RepID=A0A3E1F176_9FLAO|nr:M48 family metallopeptidase [Brumimicrobium aurantiacum]RFC55560.1 hypothetical protein DXU93_01110 [Brumimicrobium aurantiacum]
MKINLKTYPFYCFLLMTISVFGQEDSFNNFKTTLSVGEPPSIFTTAFEDKVKARMETATEVEEDQREHFSISTNYSLNNLLTSGLVLYGDPMTKFVNKVADKLLENKPVLKEELQFFVIKTNITNALCTEPGVIFITTGLLSQIENEAQLAYVLSHEIVHYQEKHIQHSYNNSNDNALSTTEYEDMVMLSKDHEFEADANALELYHAAGYSDLEINTVFDVLMYSYLTFDEIAIDDSFFGNPDIYIPESYFPEEANPILAFEDYDDSKSTHPNIRKRREAIADEIRKYGNWKENSHFLGTEEFTYVRNIARFESVRGNLLKAEYINALYDIYILEKLFPNNEFLQVNKALAYLGLAQGYLANKKRSLVKGKKDKEGAISLLYGFFSELSTNEMVILSVRQIQDVHKAFPDSKRIKEIRNNAISNISHLRSFNVNRLEKISYHEAVELREEFLADTIQKDSISEEKELSKYDRIKRIRAEQSSTKSTTELTDENFSKFLLFDLVTDREFNNIIEEEQEKIDEERNQKTPSKKEKKQIKEDKIEGDILLLTPSLQAQKYQEFNLKKTLLFYDLMDDAISKHAPKGRIVNMGISISNDFTTEKYNEVCILTSYLIQKSNLDNGKFKDHYIDYTEMNDLLGDLTTPHILLISGEANKKSVFKNRLSGSALYINLENGEIEKSENYKVALKIRKASVGGLAFEIFSKF